MRRGIRAALWSPVAMRTAPTPRCHHDGVLPAPFNRALAPAQLREHDPRHSDRRVLAERGRGPSGRHILSWHSPTMPEDQTQRNDRPATTRAHRPSRRRRRPPTIGSPGIALVSWPRPAKNLNAGTRQYTTCHERPNLDRCRRTFRRHHVAHRDPRRIGPHCEAGRYKHHSSL